MRESANEVWIEAQENGLGQKAWAVYKDIGASSPHFVGRYRSEKKAQKKKAQAEINIMAKSWRRR